MGKEIIDNLEIMCDKNDAHDKKLLLLARLVQDSVENLGLKQSELKESLSETNRKLDIIVDSLDKYKKDISECPVYSSRKNFGNLKFLLENPRFSLFALLGVISLLSGLVGAGIPEVLKFIFGL